MAQRRFDLRNCYGCCRLFDYYWWDVDTFCFWRPSFCLKCDFKSKFAEASDDKGPDVYWLFICCLQLYLLPRNRCLVFKCVWWREESNFLFFFLSHIKWFILYSEIYFSIRQMSVLFLYSNETFGWGVFDWGNIKINDKQRVWLSVCERIFFSMRKLFMQLPSTAWTENNELMHDPATRTTHLKLLL